MKIDLPKSFNSKLEQLINLGIDSSFDFIEQKRIKTINLIIYLCLPLVFIFWLLSYIGNHPLLANYYIFLTLPLFIMLYLNYSKRKEIYRIILIVLITLYTALGAILFDNGEEYYILLIALLSILFYDLKKEVLYLSLLYACIFLTTETIGFFIKPIEPAAGYFKVINIVIFLSILIYFLYDIKKMYIEFLDEILYEKRKLEESNTMLVQQAISLELKNKDIEELKNQNEELSSIVYHQLRSPVVTFVDLLSQYLDSTRVTKEEFLEASKMIQQKTNDTLNVVDDLLKWNKKGINGIQPKILQCEVGGIIDRALTQLRPSLEKKNLKIKHSKNYILFASADPDHILIIFLNILTNAIKFSPQGESIKIDLIDLKDRCQVHISNYGNGIDREHLKIIFSTWHIVSNKGTMNETGTGLGLKICKNLVEKNKGSIKISSEKETGTTVMIELPSPVR